MVNRIERVNTVGDNSAPSATDRSQCVYVFVGISFFRSQLHFIHVVIVIVVLIIMTLFIVVIIIIVIIIISVILTSLIPGNIVPSNGGRSCCCFRCRLSSIVVVGILAMSCTGFKRREWSSR